MGERSRAALERLDEGPIYTVYLDAGAYSWLYEIIQSKTKTQIWLKPYQRLVKRTLLAFDEARRALDAPVERPTKRTIPRLKKPGTRSRKR